MQFVSNGCFAHFYARSQFKSKFSFFVVVGAFFCWLFVHSFIFHWALIYSDSRHYWLFRWYYDDDECACCLWIWVHIRYQFVLVSPSKFAGWKENEWKREREKKASNPFSLFDDFARLFRYFSVLLFPIFPLFFLCLFLFLSLSALERSLVLHSMEFVFISGRAMDRYDTTKIPKKKNIGPISFV